MHESEFEWHVHKIWIYGEDLLFLWSDISDVTWTMLSSYLYLYLYIYIYKSKYASESDSMKKVEKPMKLLLKFDGFIFMESQR